MWNQNLPISAGFRDILLQSFNNPCFSQFWRRDNSANTFLYLNFVMSPEINTNYFKLSFKPLR